MNTPPELISAIRQYKDNDNSREFVTSYDVDETNQAFIDLKMQIIDLKACLKTCFHTSKGALEQYPEKYNKIDTTSLNKRVR